MTFNSNCFVFKIYFLDIMAENSSVICRLCGFKSKVPICESPTSAMIENIIRNAKTRVEKKHCGKYRDCDKLSISQVDDLMNISFHRSCYKDFTRFNSTTSSSENVSNELKLEDFVSNYIECNVIRVNGHVDIKTITDEYKQLFKSSVESTTRKQVKLYLQNRSDLIILRPVLGNRSEVVASRKSVETAFFTYQDIKIIDEFDTLAEAFQKTRHMILAESEWQFEIVFNNFKIDDGILSLFILIGGKNPHPSKIDYINKFALLLVQYIEEIMLSERQVAHKNLFIYYLCF